MQSRFFVRCWFGNFLVQCRENLYNVGAVFAATGYYQKINRSKIKIVLKWFQTTLIRTFSCAMLSGASWTTLQRFLPVQCYPKSIKAILNRICSCTLLSWASVTTLDRIFTSAMLSQDYKTTLNTTFSCALLSWVSRTLLDRVFTCVTLSQEYLLRQHWTEFFPMYFCLKPPGQQIPQGFYLCNVVPRVLRQHWTGFVRCIGVLSLKDNIA